MSALALPDWRRFCDILAMSVLARLKRYIALYLPALLVGGLCAFIGLQGLIPALGGEIPKMKGAERIIYLIDSPATFWFEVLQRVFMLLMAPVTAYGLVVMCRSNEISDGLILRRFNADAALDKAVRRPLQPD
jgi:hypothetical protein